jgi:hypothetical protein
MGAANQGNSSQRHIDIAILADIENLVYIHESLAFITNLAILVGYSREETIVTGIDFCFQT